MGTTRNERTSCSQRLGLPLDGLVGERRQDRLQLLDAVLRCSGCSCSSGLGDDERLGVQGRRRRVRQHGQQALHMRQGSQRQAWWRWWWKRSE